MDTEIKELWNKVRPNLINIGNVLILAFGINFAVSYLMYNPNMQKITATWEYDVWDADFIDGFELFVGYERGSYDELIEIDSEKRAYDLRYEIKPGKNIYLALVAYYDIPVGKKNIRWRSSPAKISLYPDPLEDVNIEIVGLSL